MVEANLQRRILRFRWGAYAAWSSIALVLAPGADPPGPMLLLAMALPAVALVVTRVSARREALGQWIENLATPFLLAACGLPPLACLGANAALLLGTLALRGFRVALPAVGVIALGWLAGRSLAVAVTHAYALTADLLAWLFLVAFSAPLAAYGYEEATRQHRARQTLRAQSDSLERDRQTLVRFLPDDLPRRLRDGATAPERRWITVAAIDLEAFTAHLERLAPEDMLAVLDDVYGLFADLASDHGGVLHKFLGDGAIVCFGAADTRGRRAEATRCLAMVRELPQRMTALNAHWRACGVPSQLATRAGVASGFCTLGGLGRGARSDFTVVGLPVNLASRLQALAPAGGTRVDATTASLCDDALGPGTLVEVRGFAQPVTVHAA